MISVKAETLRSRTATTRSSVTDARAEAIIAWWMSCRSPVTACTASSFEVARKLITEIRRTAKLPASPAVWRAKGYADGAAELIFAVSDPLITETILGEGVGLDEARQQVKDLAAFVRKLGTVRIEIDEQDTEYRFDLVWEYKQ